MDLEQIIAWLDQQHPDSTPKDIASMMTHIMKVHRSGGDVQEAWDQQRAQQQKARAARRGPGRPRKAVDVQRAQALLSAGHSLREVGRELCVAPSTLHRAIHRA